ncbi:GP88 family protein [Allokutzneria albata]
MPAVLAAHQRNLALVLDDLPLWEAQMHDALAAQRFRRAFVRMHDTGDFFSAVYLDSWQRIMRATPGTRFYCYTKEMECTTTCSENPTAWPMCFRRRSDHHRRMGIAVPIDLDAITGPRRIGIPTNNIPHPARGNGESGTSHSTKTPYRCRRRRSPRSSPPESRPSSAVTGPPGQPRDRRFRRRHNDHATMDPYVHCGLAGASPTDSSRSPHAATPSSRRTAGESCLPGTSPEPAAA